MNLKKLERKIDREKEKLTDLCQKKADVLAKQELKAQEPEDHKKSRKRKKRGKKEEEPEQTILDSRQRFGIPICGKIPFSIPSVKA